MEDNKVEKLKSLVEEGIITEEEFLRAVDALASFNNEQDGNNSSSKQANDKIEPHEDIKSEGEKSAGERTKDIKPEERKPEKKRKRKKIIKWVLISVFSLLIVSGIAAYFIIKTYYMVPNIEGLSEEEAIEKLDKKKIKYSVEYEYTDDIKEGIVYEQSAGTKTPVFNVKDFTFYVSKGYRVELPDSLVGSPIDTVKEKLAEVSDKLVIEENEVDTTEYAKGIVTEVSADKELYNDGTVKLTISKGILKEYPDIQGKQIEETKKILDEAGINYTIKEYYSRRDKGFVLNGISGKYYADHETPEVTLEVSKGGLPDFWGKDFNTTKKELETLGLTATRGEEFNSVVAKGKVIRLDGTDVDKITHVDIIVSKGAGKDASDYVGDDVYSAKKALEKKGFKVNLVNDYSDISDYDVTTGEIGYGGLKTAVTAQSVKGLTDKDTVTLNYYKGPITISQVNFSSNYVGGIDVTIKFKNISDKQIKYIVFTCNFYDRVGEKAYCSVRRDYKMKLQYTGPLNAGKADSASWDAVIYNPATAVVMPSEIEVTFTDGDVQHISCQRWYWYHNDFYGGKINY